MPWSKDDYPASMKNLSAEVRTKAISIANSLLGDGMSEGRAIRIGIKKAEEWASAKGRRAKSKMH